MLRGNHPARVDEKGRLKIPNGFRVLVEQQYGAELFVTSVSGEYVRIYPMAVWLEIERRLAEVPSANPSKQRFLDREALVIGVLNRFEVWAPDRWDAFVVDSERLLEDATLDVQWPLPPAAPPEPRPPGHAQEKPKRM